MTSDKASAHLWTLSNEKSQEGAPNLSIDKG